jgi:ParB-like chromosome segregation protein Spo0J
MEMKTTTPKIEHLKVEDLIPYATNSRTHSPEQVAQIAASMVEFGWTNPVLIDARGTIVAGHGRIMAARKLGMETVPCIRLGHLSPAQVRAYVIADNKLALNAGWDEQMLAAELKQLEEDGFDLGLTGFTEDEIAKLIGDPEPDRPKEDVQISAAFEVIAECEHEEQQQLVYNLLQEKGVKCRLVTL